MLKFDSFVRRDHRLKLESGSPSSCILRRCSTAVRNSFIRKAIIFRVSVTRDTSYWAEL